MAHGTLIPDFWEDERLTSCTVTSRLLAAFLITGRPAIPLPGLINLGMAGLAEAVHLPPKDTTVALRELVVTGFAQVDERARLIRVPRAPKHAGPINGNCLRAWYTRWKHMPPSQLREAHVASIREALSDGEWVEPIWKQTFGFELLNHSRMVEGTILEWLPEPFPNGRSKSQSKSQSLPDSSGSSGRPEESNPRAEVTRRDLEDVYAQYPRKKGKSKGLEVLARQVVTAEDLAKLRRAVANAVAGFSAEGRPEEFIPYFSSWVSTWRDDVDPPARVAGGNGKLRSSQEIMEFAATLGSVKTYDA